MGLCKDWYRSLKRTDAESSKSQPEVTKEVQSEPFRPAVEKPTKNNWFILNALKSQDPPVATQSSSSWTLADLLDRNPPPRPSEAKFTPPVWLAIGPSNKGFNMLERNGWTEGEALGRDVVRQTKKSRQVETVDVQIGSDDDVWQVKQVPIIDLTLSDSESDQREAPPNQPLPDDNSPYARKALLTPISTVLKSDRLGIGLKAKTTGPYKESVKRVTHSAAALAAHTKASEDLKRRKKLHRRGQRGFAKRRREEEDQRRAMVAYLNT